MNKKYNKLAWETEDLLNQLYEKFKAFDADYDDNLQRSETADDYEMDNLIADMEDIKNGLYNILYGGI